MLAISNGLTRLLPPLALTFEQEIIGKGSYKENLILYGCVWMPEE